MNGHGLTRTSNTEILRCAQITCQKRSEQLFDIPSGAKAALIFHPLRTG
jgi:hypothetical protein